MAIVGGLAESTSQVDWKLWRKAESGKKEDRTEVVNHAALDTWNRPNRFYTRQEFVETFQQHEDLTGEAWWLIGRNEMFRDLPLELWPVRPDKMQPVPDPEEFLNGYVYNDPDGKKIPLQLDEVIMLRRPSTLDPYRGMGPIAAIMTDIGSAKLAAEWNANFFRNSALPGGIIEVEKRLDDPEFDEMRDRWNEQHKGVYNAHRVAIIEQGKWVDRKYSMKDMEFVTMRELSSEIIRQAYRYPKPMLGTVEDVNRANAEAAEVMYARWMIVPRLERIKQALNNDFLPLYGATTKGLEFDYENPVPDDAEAEDRARLSKSESAAKLVSAGYDPVAVLEAVGLPEMGHTPRPDPAALAPDPPKGKAPTQPPSAGHRLPVPRAAADPHVDVGELESALESALETLLTDWRTITDAQRDALVDAIREAVESGSLEALLTVAAPDAGGAEVLTAALVAMAAVAGAQVVQEATAQGVDDVLAHAPTESVLAGTAAVVAATMAGALGIVAVREALRLYWSGSTARQIATAVREYLDERGEPRSDLSSALHGAAVAGRIETMKAAPEAAYYGNEQMDGSTCKYCREVHNRWLGNSIEDVLSEYPNGGYVRCLGRSRCRGVPVAVWRGGNDPSKWIEKEPVHP